MLDLLATALKGGGEKQDEEVLRQVEEELETLQPKRKLSLTEEDVEAALLGNFFTVLFAGATNSAATAAACMSLLANNPDVQGLLSMLSGFVLALNSEFHKSFPDVEGIKRY